MTISKKILSTSTLFGIEHVKIKIKGNFMPINFATLKPYSIDYPSLMKRFETFPLFDNINLKKNYLNQWKTILEKADQHTIKMFSQLTSYPLLAGESFQQETIYGNNNIIINFNIQPLIEIAKNNKQYASNMPLAYFDKSKEFVTWTHVPNADSTIIKDIPILLTHFYNARTFGFLLIDGNHRLSQAFKNNKKTIKTLILRPETMIDDNLFRSQFDKLFFIFQNELYYIYHYKKNYQMNDKELFSYSYLNNSKFNFSNFIPDLHLK